MCTTRLYPYGSTLAAVTYRGMRMEIVCRAGVLELSTVGGRADNSLAPRGLQRFEESRFPAPVFVVSGTFPRDAEIAGEWLNQHAASIFDSDSGRSAADILR